MAEPTIYDDMEIRIVCNRVASKHLMELLELFKKMGSWGCTRDFQIPDMKHATGEGKWFVFDGDGPDRIRSIELKQLPLSKAR